MRRKFDKRILQGGIVLFLVICGCIIFYYVLFNSQDFSAAGARLIRLFLPIIMGAFFAYILNPAMMFIEKRVSNPIINLLFKKSKRNTKPIKRTISIIITMSLFLAFLYAMINLVVPQVVSSIENIIIKFPAYADSLNVWFNSILEDNPEIKELLFTYTSSMEEWFMNSAVPKIQDLIKSASTGIIGGVMSVIKALLNLIIGLIVSIYLLANKELFCAQAKKIVYASLREERANNLINNARFANKTFGGFLSGKILDSIIIGVLCFVVISMFKIPYAVLISVIVGVTNIIPYFGPFLGAIPSAIIILMIDPMKCLTFVIIVLILQQVDGNIIGPKILGDSTGLSSFWVIFAITLFGGLFGVFGMFIGVPVFAVIYAAIKTFVNQRLEKKELPVSTSFYMESDYHSDEIINSGEKIKFVKKTFDNIYVEGKKKVVKVTTEEDNSTNDSTNNQ
ncbi:MAG: AI-2E family transporter [Lachnospiraceae bacterium]|nr:AI-2E family transporter [Lachnospiraceae bacterium]